MIDERDLPALDGVRRLDEQWQHARHPDAPVRTDRAERSTGPVGAGRPGRPDPSHPHEDASQYEGAGTDWSVTAQLAASVVVPGAAAWRRHPFVAAALAIAGVVVPLALVLLALANRDRLIGFALDQTVLLVVAVVAVAAIVARLAAVVEVVYANRHSSRIGLRGLVAGVVVAALAVPALGFAARATDARSTLAGIFVDDSGDPLFEPATASPGVDPDAVENILIIGGDAGPGRWGMRTDTMMLVTVHQASGRTALTSIPRNLTSLQFAPGSPLAAQFPGGFDDLANALFTHVNGDPSLVAHYGASGMQAEALALVEGIGYSLDVEIDDFALVNMQGFADVIDAVGGVTVELLQSVPLPPTLPGERELPPSIGPGFVQMDGAMAIAYARSREADSDYQRMGRQRQLLAALGSQVSATEALGAFSTVTGVLDDSMRTSLSSGEFDSLLDRLGDNSAIMESVGLAPPLITPGSPDWAAIRSIVASVQSATVTGQPSGYGS